VTKTPAVEWATKNYAEVLGLGDLYAADDAGTDFVAGGGQRMTCRQHARVGQLLANMGAWPMTTSSSKSTQPQAQQDAADQEWGDGEGDGDGTWAQDSRAQRQLISKELCAEILTPQMPHVSKSYGLLTWLGGATADPHDVKCCAPRWGTPGSCSGKKLEQSILGDDIVHADGGPIPPELRPPLLPTDVGLGMGWLGQYMYILPSERLVVVSLGESWCVHTPSCASFACFRYANVEMRF
jgi:CubicO group peptidase (beta-lactamase class C family)